MTADGTEVKKNRSFTPVTSKILNLPSRLRSRMSNIQLHAVFPESVKDYNSLLRPVALQLQERRPGGGNPIRIRHPRTGARMHLYVQLAYLVNDLRGGPACTGGTHPPAIEGSCVECKVRGLHRQNRTVVPASVRALPSNSALRREWALEYSKDDTLKSYATMTRPARRTKAEALASAGRVLRRESNKKDEAFATVSAFSELLPYHDVTKHNKVDLAHTVANAVKLLTEQVTNTGSKKGISRFGAKQREAEVNDLRRFQYLVNPRDRHCTVHCSIPHI